ncbi:YwqG family protein [Mechercharimyces sp. CAU 1602]|uniref:YwqG family protein n=1 Tax=Mechercharimyces sp. CAU 1602 TaxID=2973933 RepID=UPI002162B1C7|nr:YwqG family protein [Mechercharimyces sp. CAU 1602]MCS1351489.1 YwqG family protein [Mechercharimyces sp. CAU 1602]
MMKIPDVLKPLEKEILSSIRPYISISLDTSQSPMIYQSKVGGNPYLPIGATFPTDEKGKPMKLLAQINFAEVPFLEDFPQTGILQFYLSMRDDLYGCDFDDPCAQRNFRIMYHPEVITRITELTSDFPDPQMEQGEEYLFPLGEDDEMRMMFTATHGVLSYSDYRYDEFEEEYDLDRNKDGDENNSLDEVYRSNFSGEGHKIGGYAFFTQTDPRMDEEERQKYDVLLFQLDSDSAFNVMWGDMGVGNFFITKEDLQQCNFANVMYNWDCG